MTRGRGGSKLDAAVAASQTIAGLRAGWDEVHVGMAGLLWWVFRMSPALAYRLMRDG